MKKLIDPERPLSGVRSEFNMFMRAVREGWLNGEEAESLLCQAIEFAKLGQLPLRQLRQLLAALHKRESPLLAQLADRVGKGKPADARFQQLINEFLNERSTGSKAAANP